MHGYLQEIAELTSFATTQPTPTAIPGVWIIKGDVPQHQLAAIYEPMVGFVVRGEKLVSIGDQLIHLKAPAYFVVPTELPASGRVRQGKDGYLSVSVRLNPAVLRELLSRLPHAPPAETKAPNFCACPADEEFTGAWVRMLRLLRTPKHIPALAPVYEREILFRVLMGPEGWRLKKIYFEGGRAPGVFRAIERIRENYSRTIDVKKMASNAGMGITTFHRQFKRVTGLSPIQFQKQLRLLEARKLMAFGGHSAAGAAFEVGYESTSQFSREYSRLFGASPGKDAFKLSLAARST